MPTHLSNRGINPNEFRFRRYGSSTVGFQFNYFALGPSFQILLEPWNLLKIVISCIMSFTFSVCTLSANYIRRRFPRFYLVGSLKTQAVCLVLMLTSLYYYHEDRSKQGKTGEKGYRSTLRLIYFHAFALMSMSLSTQAQPGFELGTPNFFLACLVVGIIRKNFMVGVGVAVLCYVVMSTCSYSDSRQEQRRRGGDETHGIVVVGDGLLEETPTTTLSPLPLTIHPSRSLSTRRRPVNLGSSPLLSASYKLVKIRHGPYRNLECSVILSTPSPILTRHISLKTLNYVCLSAREYSSLLRLGRDFTRALPHLRFLFFWIPESKALIPSDALRMRQLTGSDTELLNFIPTNNYYFIAHSF